MIGCVVLVTICGRALARASILCKGALEMDAKLTPDDQ